VVLEEDLDERVHEVEDIADLEGVVAEELLQLGQGGEGVCGGGLAKVVLLGDECG